MENHKHHWVYCKGTYYCAICSQEAFCCPSCTKPFSKQTHLDTHMLSHTKNVSALGNKRSIDPSSLGRRWKMVQDQLPVKIYSGRFESNRSKH